MTEEAQVKLLKALAHPVRYRLLTALAGRELNVGEIEEATGVVQPGLSQQLAVLRKAGLVDTRKQAKLVFYRLEKGIVAELADAIAALAGASTAPQSAPRRPAPGAANFARLN